MEVTRHRAWLAAGTVALLLAGGPVAATAQSTGRPAPEWQQYDQLDDRFGALAWLTFGEVIGSEVVDKQGTRVGSIVGLVRAKSDGMFHAVIDSREPAGAGDQVVPVERLEVVGDSKEARQIVLTGEGTTDFDAADFEAAAPSGATKTEG